MENTDRKAIDVARAEVEQRRLNRRMAYFFEQWAPRNGPREAAAFHADFHSVVQAVYSAAAAPFAKQFGDAMVLAAPHMTMFGTDLHAGYFGAGKPQS